MRKNVKIHHTSEVHIGSIIGEGTEIGAFCLVGSGCIIGKNVKIGNYCEIRNGVRIGDNTTMGSRCTISSGAKIGKYCTIKYGFVLTDTPDLNSPAKVVGDVGDNVKIGANVTLMPGIDISNDATIGSCSQVRHDVPVGEVWYGNPANKMI